MRLEDALAETALTVLALPLAGWEGPVLPQIGREGVFGAAPSVCEIQLHYLDAAGPGVRPSTGVLVSNRLSPTTWSRGDGAAYGIENPLAAHLENFVARFVGAPPRPALERSDFLPLDVPVPVEGATASRHRTYPLEVVEMSADPDGPMGVEVCVAAWALPVSDFVSGLEPLPPDAARAIDARPRGAARP